MIINNSLKLGDTINFILDGNPAHKGAGIITRIDTDNVEVKLSNPLKEFLAGDEILVFYGEIIS